VSFIKKSLDKFETPIKVSAVVGTMLCLINGNYYSGVWWRIVLNYSVPFLVAFYSQEVQKKK